MNHICKKMLTVAAASSLLFVAGCSKPSEPAANTSKEPEVSSVVSAVDTPSTPAESSEQTTGNTASAGDTSGKTKTIGDFEVTMDSASTLNVSGPFTPEEGNIYVVTVFTIKNNSDETVEISSGTNFEATADGQDIYQAWVVEPEGVEWIDGEVASGQTISGCVCFEAPENFSEINVNFVPDIMEEDVLTFTLNK